MDLYRSSRSQVLFKIGVLKNFANFTGKHLCWSQHLQWLLLSFRSSQDSIFTSFCVLYNFLLFPVSIVNTPKYLKALKNLLINLQKSIDSYWYKNVLLELFSLRLYLFFFQRMTKFYRKTFALHEFKSYICRTLFLTNWRYMPFKNALEISSIYWHVLNFLVRNRNKSKTYWEVCQTSQMQRFPKIMKS